MSAPLPTNTDFSENEETDGLTALAGAAVAGLVLALGFVALMARVGGPAPVQASVQEPAAAVAPAAAPAPLRVQSLYDASESH